MMRMKSILIAALFSCLTSLSCKPDQASASEETKTFLVTKVVDGDTFYASDAPGKDIKVRLIGVDAPESRRTPREEVQYYGKEAKAYVQKLLLNKKVRLEFDVQRYDRYKRTLAYVYLTDGTFVNAHLVKHGYANVMTVPPNVKFAKHFVKLEREARERNRGMWGKK